MRWGAILRCSAERLLHTEEANAAQMKQFL